MSPPEWDVTSDPPTVVTADSPQQAADERVRLELESPADEDPAPVLYVRPAGTEEAWAKVHPAWPDLTPDGI